jgi:PAS domain S-box-containing protein
VKIDVFTIVIIFGITLLVQVIIFLIEYFYHKKFKGPGWWLMWSLAAFGSFCFMLARQVKVLEHFSILGQNILMFLALSFIYIGIMRFLGKKERINWLIAIFIAFIAPFTYYVFLDDNIQSRTIILWSAVAALSFLSAHDLWFNKTESLKIAANICVYVFLGHGLFSSVKVVLLLNGSEITSINSPQFINTFSYFESLVASILWTYSMIMMINQRMTSDMERSKDHFEVIFNTSPDPILITKLTDGTITSVNDRFQELSGFAPQEVLGRTTQDLNLWQSLADRDNFISLIRKEGHCFNLEAAFQLKDRSVISCLISSQVINLNDTLQIMSIIRDISWKKKREDEIVEKNAQLMTINAEKDKLFSIIAHDLRNPFSTFLGLTEIMADELPQMTISETKEMADKMRTSAKNIFGLLENLLEWALIKQGIRGFNPGYIALYPEIQESTKYYLYPAQKKQISIIVKVSELLMVYADKDMLRSLVRNLLSNAIKFTPNGGSVTISAMTLPDKSCLISMEDTGIGISEEIQDRLFKIGFNTSRSGTDGELSSGLGLLLCHEFVARHNGKIWVESVEGKGSTFFVELPSFESELK